MSDLSGQLIDGRYQLQHLIAAGGMASIYAAFDTRLDRKVAVKIMHPHLANDEDFVHRFIREAKATASLSHPNIVAIQDQGWNEGGTPAVFLVMEFIEGFTLRELLHERGALPPEVAIQYLSPVVSALVAAHKQGIIHRDLKPENILIAKDGRVKIADFGLARGASLGSTMTVESSVVLGSVSYLAPEQVQRGVSDARSDVYSLGIMFFEMIVGQRPFDGESPIAIAYKHVNERVPAPSELKPGLPKLLDDIVLKATEPNPDKRYKDAAAMELDIQKLEHVLDPSRRQLTLELDVSPLFAKPAKSARGEKPNKRTEVSKANAGESKPPRQGLRFGSVPVTSPITRTSSSPTPGIASDAMRETTNSTAEIRRRKLSRRVKRNRFIATIIVLGALGFGWYHFFGAGSGISVPSVAGLTQTQAENMLRPLGLNVDVTTSIASEDVPAGTIISSSPGGGGHVKKGGFVHLTISTGPAQITVPLLVGLSPADANKAIAAAGLQIGTTSQAYSDTVTVGAVIDGVPSAGTQVRKNTQINLLVSQGPAPAGAQSYVGLTSDQALNELTAAGYNVLSKYGYSETVPPGSVISQSPPANTPLPKGSNVTIVISSGSAKVQVPNVLKESAKSATANLENLGFVVKVKSEGARKSKVVIATSPKAGSKLKRGGTVTITVR